MPKTTTKFVCQQCAYESVQWMGRCPNCATWNSLVETREEVSKGGKVGRVSGEGKPVRLAEIKKLGLARISTGIGGLDRVLGGGLVPGSVILLAGDPGIGKSTLLLQVAANISANRRQSVLYVSGEESPEQIKIRAERLGIRNKEILFLTETNVDVILETIEKSTPLVIIDSIQTMWTQELTGTSGSVGQVRESAGKLLNFAKLHGVSMFLVGHVTKEGGIAGPMVLAHLVDTILFFEGERFQKLRILRGVKNRFGSIDEVGVFSMEERGLVEVADPSELFITKRQEEIPGSVVTCLLEGSRPLLLEIQALVVPSQLAVPRRVGSGIDWNRLQLLVAVLSRRAGLPLSSFDIFVNVVGGIKITEPAADLAISLAIASAWADKTVDARVCALGEVGLLGETRMVAGLEKRVKEAKRLGFTQTVTPEEVKTLIQAIKMLVGKT